jgi:hypothetical protein
MNGKDLKGSGLAPISRYASRIRLDDLSKTTEYHSQGSWSLARDLNLGPYEHELRIFGLPLKGWSFGHLVTIHCSKLKVSSCDGP